MHLGRQASVFKLRASPCMHPITLIPYYSPIIFIFCPPFVPLTTALSGTCQRRAGHAFTILFHTAMKAQSPLLQK